MNDAEGLGESQAVVERIVRDEMENHNIPSTRIVLGGFSQGGAVSMWTALQSDLQYAGVLCLSAYMPRHTSFRASESAKSTPVLMCHGDADPVVPLDFARLSYSLLRANDITNVEMKTYSGMQHQASMEEIEDVITWIQAKLPPLTSS